MAERISKAEAQGESRDPEQDATDLEILHPERDLQIGGKTVTVREIGFVEGMRIAGQVAPIIETMATFDDTPSLDAVSALVGEHTETFLDLMARCTDEPREWIESLGDADGQALLLCFWTVNANFFIRRLVVQREVGRLQNERASRK